jgi:methylamine dehydrogenase accessory protein MauD
MQHALLVSTVLLWIAVVLLSGVLFALVRQLGVLHERIAPAGALMLRQGPRVGEAAPVERAIDLDGQARVVGGAASDGRSTLLFFLSPTCPVCKVLLPALRSIEHGEAPWLRVLLVGDGSLDAHKTFVREARLERFEYAVSPTLGITYQVGKLPYAVLIDSLGFIRAKGLVNTREHLESLFEAKERGVASIQEFLGRAHDRTGAA